MSVKVLAQNRKAWHDYEILETLEAGMVLVGSEVKSAKGGHVTIQAGYVAIHNGEAMLHGVNIAPFVQAGPHNHDPLRTRKLLLHKKEIDRLAGVVKTKGITLIPLKVVEKRGLLKLDIGLARGKRDYDKRHSIKEKDENRDLQRELKNYKGRIG